MLTPFHQSRSSQFICAMLFAVALTLSTADVSRAALIAYEGFEYPDGVDLTGQNGGTGWTSSSTCISSSCRRPKTASG